MLESFIAHAQPVIGGGSGTLTNPLPDITSVQAFIAKLLDLVVQIGLPVVVLMIVYCGFLFVTARGDTEQLKTAKTAIVWTLIGAAVVLGASVISQAICGTINQLGATNSC